MTEESKDMIFEDNKREKTGRSLSFNFVDSESLLTEINRSLLKFGLMLPFFYTISKRINYELSIRF